MSNNKNIHSDPSYTIFDEGYDYETGYYFIEYEHIETGELKTFWFYDRQAALDEVNERNSESDYEFDNTNSFETDYYFDDRGLNEFNEGY